MNKSLLQENKIPELQDLDNFHSTSIYDYKVGRFNYEDNLLFKSISPVLLRNKNMYNFISQLNELLSFVINSVSILRNYNNLTVDKNNKKYTN